MDIETLHKLVLFETLSEEQLEWLAANSEEVKKEAGEILFSEGQPAPALFVLVEGEWRLTRRMSGHETIITTTTYSGSWIGGIPLIGGSYQATTHVMQPSRFLKIPNESLKYMLDHGFPIATHLIAGISIGARNSEALMRQSEKMAALGKLSAGLAHELNNPAAAARRAAEQMRETINNMQASALKLNQQLSADQLGQLELFRQEAVERAKNPPKYEPLEQSEHEDEISSWLDEYNVPDGWEIAPTLVEAGLDSEWLERLTQAVGGAGLAAVMDWLNCTLTAQQLLSQIENSSERISTMVKAVKEYSYMDQAPLQELDVHDGLESTLTMLTHKLKQGITVHKEFDRSLPRINAFGSELNQVWTNLIDNAVDAMNGQGELWLRTRRDGGDHIMVEVADNGPGVPPEIQSRVFEPFFTTKGVGQGSGLGLDIAYRIVVMRHKGDIKLTSKPGDTRFTVWLPIEPPK